MLIYDMHHSLLQLPNPMHGNSCVPAASQLALECRSMDQDSAQLQLRLLLDLAQGLARTHCSTDVTTDTGPTTSSAAAEASLAQLAVLLGRLLQSVPASCSRPLRDRLLEVSPSCTGATAWQAAVAHAATWLGGVDSVMCSMADRLGFLCCKSGSAPVLQLSGLV